jgi:hypothetical protein
MRSQCWPTEGEGGRHEGVELCTESVLKQLRHAMEAGLYRFRPDRKTLRRLGDAHALDRSQDKDTAEIIGQSIDGILK